MSKLFKIKPTRQTVTAFIAGGIMIALSLLMLPFSGSSRLDTFLSFLIRDVCMIFGLGIVFVSLYLEKHDDIGMADLGFSKRRIKLSLVLNIIFAAGLLAMFLSEGLPQNVLSLPNLYAATYIIVAGLFEMTFIYGFLRMCFEKAFGIIPAIILTSIFYSLHHAGFQPEFLHLFFVGLMYCAVFYITQNLFIIFPFFWGVGALWDVIVSSDSGEGIKNIESFIFALVILALSLIWIIFRKIWRKK